MRLGGLVGRRHLGLLIAQERTCILWYEREEKLLVRCYLDGLTKSNMPRLYSREPTLDLANDGSLMTEALMLGPLKESLSLIELYCVHHGATICKDLLRRSLADSSLQHCQWTLVHARNFPTSILAGVVNSSQLGHWFQRPSCETVTLVQARTHSQGYAYIRGARKALGPG